MGGVGGVLGGVLGGVGGGRGRGVGVGVVRPTDLRALCLAIARSRILRRALPSALA